MKPLADSNQTNAVIAAYNALSLAVEFQKRDGRMAMAILAESYPDYLQAAVDNGDIHEEVRKIMERALGMLGTAFGINQPAPATDRPNPNRRTP